jgi:signal transduction histidine kinase
MLLTLVVLLSVFGWISIRDERQALEGLLKQHGNSIVHTISASTIELLLMEDYPVLETFLHIIGGKSKRIGSIEVIRRGSIVASYRFPEIVEGKTFSADIVYSPDPRLPESKLGEVRLLLSDYDNNIIIENRRREVIKYIAVKFCILMVIFTFILRKTVLGRIIELTQFAERITSEKSDKSEFIQLDDNASKDEIDILHHRFGAMLNRLLKSKQALEKDIRRRKKAESRLKAREQALMRSNKELERFAFVASHDLQEPLRKIQAFGGRLKSRYENVLDDQGHDYLKRMQSAAGRMSILIEDLLLFSRISTQGQTLEQVDLNGVVAGVLSDLELRITETGAKLEVSELPTLLADPMQMRQLFQNLIGNALKFHRADVPPVVRVSAEVVEQHSTDNDSIIPMYRFLVQDNGIGFDPRYLDKIFQVFQRLHCRDEYDGTGVGLAICRRIAERHGGTLTAESRPGKGATFIVTLRKIHEDADQGEKAHVP